MNLPLASLHGLAARAGAEPARRLNADKASTNFFMTSPFRCREMRLYRAGSIREVEARLQTGRSKTRPMASVHTKMPASAAAFGTDQSRRLARASHWNSDMGHGLGCLAGVAS